jgi:hypothetical protein
MMHEFGILPDDPFYERINPYLKVWLYESWLHDKELEIEKLKQHAILTGSFFNPEAANKMIQDENPDLSSTDFEEKEKKTGNKRKKRKVIS